MAKIRLIKEAKVPQQKRSQLIREFIGYCLKELNLKSPLPKIKLTANKKATQTYGHMQPGVEIVVYTGNRNLGDCLRTISHELVHVQQEQLGKITEKSGETGSPQENEANAIAGVLLREFGKKHPEIFE